MVNLDFFFYERVHHGAGFRLNQIYHLAGSILTSNPEERKFL